MATTALASKHVHRIWCVPVRGRHLAFYLRAIPLSAPVTSADYAKWKEQESATEKMRMAALKLSYWTMESMQDQWEGLESAPKSHWKGKVYSVIDSFLLTHIHAPEVFCRAVELPKHNSPVIPFEIIHSEAFDRKEVLSQMQTMLTEAKTFHKRWFFWSNCMLPITSMAYLIPGPPNLPFYWNAFRSYAHYTAKRGALYMHLLLHGSFPAEVEKPSGLFEKEIDELPKPPVFFSRCDILDKLPNLEDDQLLDEGTIDHLSKTFDDKALAKLLQNARRRHVTPELVHVSDVSP